MRLWWDGGTVGVLFLVFFVLFCEGGLGLWWMTVGLGLGGRHVDGDVDVAAKGGVVKEVGWGPSPLGVGPR